MIDIREQIDWFYYDEPQFNSIQEYIDIVIKIDKILHGRKVSLKSSLDKITLLGWDALVLLVKLSKATKDFKAAMEEIEAYEICSLLRDINTQINSYLYDYQE